MTTRESTLSNTSQNLTSQQLCNEPIPIRNGDKPTYKVAYKQLPETLLNFICESIWSILRYHPSSYYSVPRKLPGFLHYVTLITRRAQVNRTLALVTLIYVERLKKKMPSNSVGDYGFCHRVFTASLLVAYKVLYGEDSYHTPTTHEGPLRLSSGSLSALTNNLFSPREISLMERTFLQLIDFNVWVTELDIREFVRINREDLILW
ncbi:uncharacterized protein VTP21DRAFT_6079 [Calcarisporiella thermophila]|uniref:uncharacterized protein n=1 Tax=Calcarisporiella thermophila TaxID=911321 RepID=UPI003743C383